MTESRPDSNAAGYAPSPLQRGPAHEMVAQQLRAAIVGMRFDDTEDLARRALEDLAEASLEEQVLKVFVQRVRSLDAEEREAIVAAVRDSSREVEVRTAFPLQAQGQADLSRVLREQFGDDLALRFSTVPQLVCGVELRAHSYRLSWNLDAYLEDMEARLFEALEESADQDAAAR